MNRDIFASLVKEHQAQIYRYLRYLGADRSSAQDLVQDTFVAVWKSTSCPETAEARNMAAWLRGIARNMFRRHCRNLKTQEFAVDHATLERVDTFWSNEFLREGDGFETLEALRYCLEQIPEKQQNVLDMRYRDKCSRTQMATSLSMTEDGVKSLLRRIRAALAKCIGQRMAEERP